MTRLLKYCIVAASLTLLNCVCAGAQEASADSQLYAINTNKPVRPVTSAYMIEGGTAHLADTYLTPLHYSGMHLGLQYERTQAVKANPQNLIMQLNLGLRLDLTQNPAKNADMSSAMIDASWALMRRWQVPRHLAVGIGGSLSLNAGALYLSRNGNNPASARGAVNANAVAYAAWNSHLRRIPFTLRYQVTMPVIGTFFSPNYAQLYYQIYIGDHQGLMHAAWWGNYFMMDNLLTADLHFGATSVRLGYRGRFFSSKINHLVTRDISHALVLGIVCDWISLRPGKNLPDAKVISAY